MCAFVSTVFAVLGCTPSIISSDAGIYYSGKLYAVSSTDLTGVYEATLNAMQDLEFEVTEKAKDVFYAKVVAKGADGKKVTITIKPKEDNLTELNIKVDLLGNEQRSRVIYEHILQRLSVGKK